MKIELGTVVQARALGTEVVVDRKPFDRADLAVQRQIEILETESGRRQELVGPTVELVQGRQRCRELAVLAKESLELNPTHKYKVQAFFDAAPVRKKNKLMGLTIYEIKYLKELPSINVAKKNGMVYERTFEFLEMPVAIYRTRF